MIIFPAIDLIGGECVRLYQGDYGTAHRVAESPLTTALAFQQAGATWLHVVDLDGAKAKEPKNRETILQLVQNTKLSIEVGGGIRTIKTIADYLEQGVARVILGSVALQQPELVKEAIAEFGSDKIVVGIDAKDGMVAAEGWMETSQVDYITLAKKMEEAGVSTIIFTDIAKDGMLQGPNLVQLKALQEAVSCNIVASGGISCQQDLLDCKSLGLYGAICGKSLYEGKVNLKQAIAQTESQMVATHSGKLIDAARLDSFFQKDSLVPAIVQEASTGEVLMLAYMNRESLQKTLETGYTWFYSRSRQELWNKGATSGHLQKVCAMYGDCDDDTLLLTVEQTGAACHTGNHTCFYQQVWREKP